MTEEIGEMNQKIDNVMQNSLEKKMVFDRLDGLEKGFL